MTESHVVNLATFRAAREPVQRRLFANDPLALAMPVRREPRAIAHRERMLRHLRATAEAAGRARSVRA